MHSGGVTGLQNRPVAGVRRVSAGGSVGVGRRGVNREGVLTARGWGCWAAWKGRVNSSNGRAAGFQGNRQVGKL